jgi:hypothetical protein
MTTTQRRKAKNMNVKAWGLVLLGQVRQTAEKHLHSKPLGEGTINGKGCLSSQSVVS